MTTSPDASKSANRIVSAGLVGLVLGGLVGVIVDLIVLFGAFVLSLSNDRPVRLDGLVRTTVDAGAVSVTGGGGMIAVIVILTVVGALAGALRQLRQGRYSTDHD